MPTALSQQQLLYNISHPPPANNIKMLFYAYGIISTTELGFVDQGDEWATILLL